jgi:hypothetical protein
MVWSSSEAPVHHIKTIIMIRSDTTSSVGYVQASKHRMMWKQHYLTCLACNRIFRSKSCLARTNFANLKPINSIKDLLNQKTVPASRCEWKHQTGSGRTGWSTAGQWYQCHFALQKAKRISQSGKDHGCCCERCLSVVLISRSKRGHCTDFRIILINLTNRNAATTQEQGRVHLF